MSADLARARERIADYWEAQAETWDGFLDTTMQLLENPHLVAAARAHLEEAAVRSLGNVVRCRETAKFWRVGS